MNRNPGYLAVSLALVAVVAGCSSRAAVYPSSTAAAAPTIETNGPVTVTTYADGTPPTSLYAPSTDTFTASPAPLQSLTPHDEPTIIIGFDGVFDPASLTVPAGTEVSFLNEDCCNWHTVYSDYPFSKKMEASGTARFTFTKAGKYIFWLDNTQWVYGTITVS